jgi:hypothetical protein
MLFRKVWQSILKEAVHYMCSVQALLFSQSRKDYPRPTRSIQTIRYTAYWG